MEKTLRFVYNSPRLSFWLKLLSFIISLLTVAAFTYMFFALWHESFFSASRMCLVCGIPFLAVTLLRKFVNAPRPYELYDFYILPPKDRRGRSFPSRHAFSIFCIGVCLCTIELALGIILLALGVLLCIARVLLGIHFVRDVIAGALIGVCSAALGILILAPI